MAPDEYSTGGGGKLKLKGSKVSDGRVDKKKKKKAKKEKDAQGDQAERTQRSQRQGSGEADADPDRDGSRERDEEVGSSAKTEAERKYEEVRRKRLHERLQKEGIKSHKERVEDLNKYLSRLSEHHDMPKIGPG